MNFFKNQKSFSRFSGQQKKIVQRNLAARNVLVCENKIVKTAEFGLSRDIYEENINRKSSAGRLPMKWLALEPMLYQQSTSQSDV